MPKLLQACFSLNSSRRLGPTDVPAPPRACTAPGLELWFGTRLEQLVEQKMHSLLHPIHRVSGRHHPLLLHTPVGCLNYARSPHPEKQRGLTYSLVELTPCRIRCPQDSWQPSTECWRVLS
jgi:hypothetical protein